MIQYFYCGTIVQIQAVILLAGDGQTYTVMSKVCIIR